MKNIPMELKAVIDCNLPVNASRRILHRECSGGKDPALSVKRLREGYVFHCFRCGFQGFIGGHKLPTDQILTMVKGLSVKVHAEMEKIDVPADSLEMYNGANNETIPMKAFTWLWEAGLTDELVEEYHLLWSSSFRRVIIPITDEDNTLLGWVGRDVFYDKDSKHGNKYILRKQEGLGRRIYFTCQGPKNGNKVIVVEDPLSAIRIHFATGLETVALLNTHVGSDLLHEYMTYKMVIWLDDGQLANMVGIVARAQSYGINCSHINTTKDPKNYNDVAIKEHLKGGING